MNRSERAKRDAEIERAYTGGATTQEIAASLGISGTAVRNALAKRGVSRRRACPRGGPRPIPPDRARKMVLAYQAGATLHQVAKATGVAHRKVYQALQESGISSRRRGPKTGSVSPLRRLPNPCFLRNLRRQGLTLKQIGKQYGVSKQAVQSFLKRHKEARDA